MSQLTSIDQCKVGMTVYHPIWGKGEISLLNRYVKSDTEIAVKFSHCKHYFYSKPGNGYNHLSHLYTEHVYICEKCEHRYELIKPQQ